MTPHREMPADTGRGHCSPLGGATAPPAHDASKAEELRTGSHPITGREPTEGPRRTK